MSLREAAALALEAYDAHEPMAVVMEDLRTALAEPEQEQEQEPVAICRTWHRGSVHHAELWKWTDALDALPDGEHRLYTHPAPQRTEPVQEPVAYLWQHCETGRTRVVMPDQIITTDATWLVVGPLYLRPPQRTEPEQKPVADSVTSILLDVVPGPDGMGEEVYAKSAADVVKKLLQVAERIEELESSHTHPVDDTALLRQALDCLENHVMQRTYAGGVVICNTAIALRERLGEKA